MNTHNNQPSSDQLLCIRCGEVVRVNAESYEVFERMHWLCFHLEYEHRADPDEPCEDTSCPWWHIEVFRRALSERGLDPQKILYEATRE
jgi:hypothetical protein